MSADERDVQLRQVAGSLAAALRQQAVWGMRPPPVELGERLRDALERARVTAMEERVRDAMQPAESPPIAGEETGARPAVTAEVARDAPRATPGRAAPARAEQVPEAAAPAARPQRAPQPPRGERPPWASRNTAGIDLGVGSDALRAIRADLGDCERCGLCERRRNIVFGVGNASARLMFVGEAPGAEEDRKGEPFVGAAGQLLDRMIGAMKLRRQDVYIANVIKCRPPGNRDPSPDEVGTCRPFLDRQIDAIKPECIVTLGRVAAQAMLDRGVSITRERGSWTEYRGVPMMLTLHPAYLLRQPEAKRDAWSDLQSVMKRLGLGGT